ncbi:hypothetical protein BDV28DRAFT_140462 [Aspergillus coremiiformis]|uniref:Uncharacterized protein n=1 Tax=Aspergillus coremiiformis TaxID=138285 RepID=A0A5N6YXW8_9EURO|nr:hypothetical protein BDV28DRAFT_140462 [Aspergillus coremiiformis]
MHKMVDAWPRVGNQKRQPSRWGENWRGIWEMIACLTLLLSYQSWAGSWHLRY